MKSGRSRRHQSHHRSKTPAVICLPPPRPPITQPRRNGEVARSGPLASRRVPDIAEIEQAFAGVVPVRTEAPVAEAPPPSVAEEALAPLPRNRALMMQPHGLMRVGNWLRSLVMVRKTKATPEHAVAQLKAMRAELMNMQQTLDHMLAGSRA